MWFDQDVGYDWCSRVLIIKGESMECVNVCGCATRRGVAGIKYGIVFVSSTAEKYIYLGGAVGWEELQSG